MSPEETIKIVVKSAVYFMFPLPSPLCPRLVLDHRLRESSNALAITKENPKSSWRKKAFIFLEGETSMWRGVQA